MDETRFTKMDFWKAVAAGEGIALLSLPVLNNIKFFELLYMSKYSLDVFLVLWMFVIPLATGVGLYFVYVLTIYRWPVVFQIGKYGIIGLLNTVMTAGIFNFFIWITGRATGLMVDFFIFIAFVVTVTHSFFWNKFWTFGANHRDGAEMEYVKFFLVTGLMALLEVAVMHILINTIGAPHGIDSKIWVNMAFAILIPMAFLGNFFGYRIFVFKK